MKIENSLKKIIFLVAAIAFFVGCKKEEGEGGTSTIRGKVVLHNLDSEYKTLKEVLPAKDEKTYIIYGTDHNTYDDDYNTSFDGSYEFKYLQKGKYRLFVYRKDTTGAAIGAPNLDDIPIFVDVEITSNGSTVDAPDLIIFDNEGQ